MVHTKRIYDPRSAEDGYRILVDRLWPRGIKKEEAHIDEWMKEVAPSAELRKWFHGGKGSFAEFRKKYQSELKGSSVLEDLRNTAREHKTITLLYASKDEKENHALVLKDLLENKKA